MKVLATLLLCLGLAACGSGAKPETRAKKADGSAEAGSGSGTGEESLDLVDTATNAGSFKTLTKLLKAAKLVDTLRGDGPFTVFAPTDAAFEKVPAEALEGLKKDAKALRRVLLMHVVDGNVKAKDAIALAKDEEGAEAKSGDALTLTLSGKTLSVNGSKVKKPDVLARNGVIHVIDAVLLPKDDAGSGAEDDEGSGDEKSSDEKSSDEKLNEEKSSDEKSGDEKLNEEKSSDESGNADQGGNEKAGAPKNIIDTALAAGSFKTLAKALTAADLIETLKGTGPFTVFAPTDEAFAALPAGTLDGLLADKAALTKILLQHVASGTFKAADVLGAKSIKTLTDGVSLTPSTKEGKAFISGIEIATTDIVCSNGVIHVIKGVIVKP